MKHLDWKRIYELAAGDISDSELDEHLKDCARCRAEFERAKAVLETLDATEEPDPVQVSRVAQAAWDARRQRAERMSGFRLGWAMAPLALAVVIGISVLIVTLRGPAGTPVQVEVEAGILSDAGKAAAEIGLKKVELDIALLEQSTQEISLDELGVETSELSELPEVTSAYLVEVLEIEDASVLFDELKVKSTGKGGQTDIGRPV